MNCRNILPLVFGVLLSTTAAAHADIEEVWRQRADAGVLAVPDGTNAVYVLYQADFAEGFAFPVVDRTISGVTFTTNNATRVFYLARYDGAGALQWIQPIGKGPRSPFGGDAGPFSGIRRMRMDSNHNLFICGNIIGSSTPTLIGTNQFTAPNYYGLPFVAKMDSSGNVLWAKVVTGSDAAGFDGLAVDGNGDAFVCGQLYGTQTFGSITVANGGGNRPFIAKINGAGNWVWANVEHLGNTSGWAFDVATDSAGNPFITGYLGAGADSGNTIFGLSIPKLGESPFVAKFNGTTGAAIWVNYAQAQGFYALSNIGRHIAVASDGSAYVAGHFYGQGVFGSTTLTPFQYAEGDVTFFLARISGAGQWLWATMGEAAPHAISAATALAVDAQDNAWVQGYTGNNYFYGSGTDGRITIAGQTLTNTSFIAKANMSGAFQLVRPTRSAGSIVGFDTNGFTYWGGPTGLGVDGLIKFGPAVAPALTTQPVGQTVHLGDNASLTATATGSPVYYQWRQDGIGIGSQVESFSTNGTFQLYLPLAKLNWGSTTFSPADIGNYTLVLSNSSGMVTSVVASVIAPAPVITGIFDANTNAITNAQPLDVVFIRGTNFAGATALSLGALQIGVPLQATFNPQLFYGSYSVLSDTQIRVVMPVYYLADSFTVTTPGGMAASPGTIQVNLPVFESASTNTVGRNQYFSTWDTPNFAFQWFKDSVPLTNGTRINGATNAFLTVSNLALGDAGGYYLVVSAGGRSVQSTNLLLTVLPQPPNLTITSSSFTSGANVGDVADFSVTATGDTPVNYQWFKDGVPLANTARISGATSASLHITSLQLTDAGTYFVVLTVAGGSIRSSDMRLQVSQTVQFLTLPRNQNLFVGSNVSFSATASGSPPIGFQWSKDGINLTNNARISGANAGTLTISNLVNADAGTYWVTVSNSSSSTFASAQLSAISPPAISTQPQSQTNRVNTFVSFFVSANGFSPLTYQWRKNGALLLGETNNSFAIFSSRVADSGGYSVVVSNPGGSVTSVVATLTVVLRTNLFSAADVVWIRQAGGTNDDRGQAVAVDPSGNVFVAGTFGDTFGQRLSTDTGSFGTNTLPANGRKQFFVAKLNPAGSVLWVRTATGTAEHEASTVTTDASGNVFVGGVFNGAALFGANSLASSGTEDAFLTKLDGAGNFLWATQAGRTNAGFGATTVQTDANGNAYWAGMFQGRLNLGTNSLASAGGYDIFLALVNRSGAVQWAKNYGGTNDDAAWSLSLQPGTTNVYLSGNFRSATTLGPTNLTGTGFNTAFLARLTGDGNVVWALASGGNGFDESLGVVADAAGNAYLTGSTTSTNFAVGALSITNLSGGCAYLLKANSGGAPQWLRKLNESGGGQSLALDAGGNPIVAGWLNLPVTYDQEIFLARLDPFGSPLGVAIAGGAGPDAANGVAVATDGSIYVTGFFQAAGIGGATFGPNAVGGLGNSDIFIAKLSGVPHRPVRIHTLAQQAGAAARLVFGHDDHSPLDINRRPRMKVLATGDLNIPRANWQQLTNTVLNADGELQLDDAGAFVTPRRFYLISDGP